MKGKSISWLPSVLLLMVIVWFMHPEWLNWWTIAIIIGIILIIYAFHWMFSSPENNSNRGEWNETDQEIKEMDVRLPYKRFKELYPSSDMTYEDYKEYQKKHAFKKSRSSEEIKRLVR